MKKWLEYSVMSNLSRAMMSAVLRPLLPVADLGA
jgi:hypothetical protein